MTSSFCTISTQSHLYKCKALFDSLRNFDSKVILDVLVIDANKVGEDNSVFEGYNLHFLEDLVGSNPGELIINKYKSNPDKLRWSLKPVFMQYLLSNKQLHKLIYVDNDIAFFGKFSFLFDLLDKHNILLTPHFYERNPEKNQNWLEANFRVGLFNAGFVAVNEKAISTLDWWAKCCLYRCEKNYMRGLFDDQKYLDLIPIIEPTTKILDHQGCNIAGWNIGVCMRELNKEGEVLINGKWPVVFIHFNAFTIKLFVEGKDPLLMSNFELYSELIQKYNKHAKIDNEAFSYSLAEKLKLKIWKVLNQFNGSEKKS